MYLRHDGCYLGRFNLTEETRTPAEWELDPTAPALNFAADFVVPGTEPDGELVRLLRERDTKGGVLDAIYQRLGVLGGHVLVWT